MKMSNGGDNEDATMEGPYYPIERTVQWSGCFLRAQNIQGSVQ